MMRPPRGLTADEAALWARVAGTVTPLAGRKRMVSSIAEVLPATPETKRKTVKFVRVAPVPPVVAEQHSEVRPLDRHGLDTSWERKLDRAAIAPDFTLDLHGYNLDAAHGRLDHGLTLAIAQNARLVLVITGKPRPVAAADRGERRGAIRAKLLDWLAAGPHASKIAAVRPAHQKHGGAGALYVVLRRHR